MLSMFRSVASDEPTRPPAVMTLQSETIWQRQIGDEAECPRQWHHERSVGVSIGRQVAAHLGRNAERLEEGRLARLHARRASRDNDVDRRERAGLGGRSDLVGQDLVAHVLEVAGREDEADVALDVREEALKGGELGEGRPDGAADPDESVRPDNAVDGHRVLAHEDLTLAAERLTDLVHLVAADIVDRDDEDRGCRGSAQLRTIDARYFSINALSFSKYSDLASRVRPILAEVEGDERGESGDSWATDHQASLLGRRGV